MLASITFIGLNDYSRLKQNGRARNSTKLDRKFGLAIYLSVFQYNYIPL